MSAEVDSQVGTTPSPAATPAAGTARPVPGKLGRKWVPAQPKPLSRRMMALIITAATALVVLVAMLAMYLTANEPEAAVPKLGAEFTDPIHMSFSIRPPANWVIEDPHDKTNIYLKGPREPGLRPLIIVSLDIAPGSLNSYLQLHKGRIEAEDKSVTWISEDSGESIDGCPNTARLEYECNFEAANKEQVRVRALQYIMEDKPRFYRVTCFVPASLYEKYLPRFEASARSFRRVPIGRANVGSIK